MSRSFHITEHLELEGDEVEVEVEYRVSPYWPATREQPAEGGEIELISVKLAGVELVLADNLERELLDRLEARAGEDLAAEAADAAEYRAEQRAEDRWLDQ